MFYFDRKRRAFVSPFHRVAFQEHCEGCHTGTDAVAAQLAKTLQRQFVLRRGRLVGLIDWCQKLAPVRAPRAPVYVESEAPIRLQLSRVRGSFLLWTLCCAFQ